MEVSQHMKLLIHLLSFTLLFYIFPVKAQAAQQQQGKNYNWETVQLQKKKLHEEILLPAIVAPKNIFPVYLLDHLPVKKVYVTEGTFVKKGDLLLTYDITEIKRKRQLLQKNIIALQNQTVIQEKETAHFPWFKKFFFHQKDETLKQIQKEWQTWKNQTKNAKYDELQMQDQALEELEKYQEVYAPFSGQITFQTTEINTTPLSKEKAPLFSLIDTTNVDIILFANIFQLEKLQIGHPITISWDNCLQKTVGTLTQISQLPKATTQQYEIKIAFSQPHKNLRMGMTGTGKLNISSPQNTNILPKECIVFENNKTFVYIIQNGKICKVPVQLGIKQTEDVEVIHGLTSSDIILKSGLDQVYDGQVVQKERIE